MDKQTIIRTIVLFVALVNQSLVLAGKSPLPFTNEEIELFLSGAFTVFASLLAWWKDNDITKDRIEKKKAAGLK